MKTYLESWIYTNLVIIYLWQNNYGDPHFQYIDVTMRAIVSQITGVWIVCPTFCSGAYQRKHPSSASLAFVRGIHRSPVDSPNKGPVTRKMLPSDVVTMAPIIYWVKGDELLMVIDSHGRIYEYVNLWISVLWTIHGHPQSFHDDPWFLNQGSSWLNYYSI